jgi:hypothetical protein
MRKYTRGKLLKNVGHPPLISEKSKSLQMARLDFHQGYVRPKFPYTEVNVVYVIRGTFVNFGRQKSLANILLKFGQNQFSYL